MIEQCVLSETYNGHFSFPSKSNWSISQFLVSLKPSTVTTMLHIQTDKDEDDNLGLHLLRHSCKVVEYLEPMMSKELLFKFPDYSAFDFDYSQSSIWSPLVPRTHSPMDLDMGSVTPRKLSFGFGVKSDLKTGFKCFRASAKKKMSPSKMKVNFSPVKMKLNKKKKKKVNASEFSPAPIKGCLPFNTKGWNKVLKAASKGFKKKKKKNDSTVHPKLSNYFRDVINGS